LANVVIAAGAARWFSSKSWVVFAHWGLSSLTWLCSRLKFWIASSVPYSPESGSPARWYPGNSVRSACWSWSEV
jgi:hypothetical protein